MAVEAVRPCPATPRNPVIADHHPIRGHLQLILKALGQAGAIDRAAINAPSGLIAALPVVAMMSLGLLIDQPVGAVTMGVGAMLVGVAWRANGPIAPPLGTMAVAAVMLALSTVIGTVSGRWPWLHLAVLFVLCLIAGLTTAIGRRGAIVGVQTLIAFIVFGRFPESLLGGLRLAGLVLAGGAAQALFAGLVASRVTWRTQREGLAAAYDQLAALAHHLTGSGVPAAEAFDAADQALARPALFADPQLEGLISLLTEGRRIRLELLVLSEVLGRRESEEAERWLTRFGDVLDLLAATLRGADPAQLEAANAELRHLGNARPQLEPPLLEARVAALAGQVRAAARQAVAVMRRGDGRGLWRLPHPSLALQRPFRIVVSDLERIRDGANLTSIPGRHALRLALVVAGTELLTQRLGLPRGYWAVVSAATVLRPNFGETFTRGAERVLGTVAGAVIATLIAVALDPQGWGIVAVIGVLAAITYTVFSASFAAGTAGLTALIVFMLHGVSTDSTALALDRGIDTVVGGAIGLAAMLLWPTWSTASLPRNLSVLVGAQRAYLGAELAAVLAGGDGAGPAIPPLARHVRVAYTDAQAALDVARGEPDRARHGLDAGAGGDVLAAMRRVNYAIHALRLAIGDAPGGHPELAGFAEALATALARIGDRLERGTHPDLPPLRELYRAHAAELPDGVGLALDELVDAINSVGATLGLAVAQELSAATPPG